MPQHVEGHMPPLFSPDRCLLLIALVAMGALVGCAEDEGESTDETIRVACEHIVQCRMQGYDDSDLQGNEDFQSVDRCVPAAQEYLKSSDSAAEALRCASQRTDCAELDDVCDVY